jgi:N,N'-diacetyl-8-epilegionaminate cytidylyltransferase
MTTYAFIFARGGSKGLPRKNVKLLAGKPLIQYSIETAQQTPGIDKVFVSTDDAEIADIATKAGALVIQRPADLAQDNSSEWLAWRHAINYVQTNYGKFDLFVSLPPTSPLRISRDVLDAIALFCQSESDACISMTKANRSPFFNMVKYNQNGYLELVNKPEVTISRRQDAPEVFDMTTVVYVLRSEFIMNKSNLFEGRVVSIEVPKVRAIDIDDIYDFLLAEAIINVRETNYA